jgi:adenylate cyclase
VVGKSKYFYDIWGPVVNLASRLQTAACPGQTFVSEHVKNSLCDQYQFIDRGNLQLKGFGTVTVWQAIKD